MAPVAPDQPGATVAIPADPTAPAADAPAAGRIRLVVAPEGNEVRYLVREQLARLDFPSDAVGATTAITGAIVVEPDGTVVPGESKFVVELATLQSDSNRRDNYVRENTLQTASFPAAELVPTAARGLPNPLPTSGPVSFQLDADLTLLGVTHATTWQVDGTITGSELSGKATTSFTFADFGIPVPQVMSVLSIDEAIRLEYDFRFVAEPDDA